MNTVAITLRPYSSTTKNWLGPERDETYGQYKHESTTHTETPAALLLEHEVARFQRTVGRERDAARSLIVNKLLKAGDPSEYSNPDEYIQTAVHTLISSARPGRLDDAIDILSECGHLLPHFVYEVLAKPQATEIDEDFWYVLIRGIGKSTLPSPQMLIETLWQKSPEAAVEALGDIGDDKSLERLRSVAAGDSSEFVRNLATEIIEECSE